MSETIPDDDLAVLRYLDEQADSRHRALGLHRAVKSPRGRSGRAAGASTRSSPMVTVGSPWSSTKAVTQTIEWNTTAPAYDDECRFQAARRLAVLMVVWDDRDTPAENEQPKLEAALFGPSD